MFKTFETWMAEIAASKALKNAKRKIKTVKLQKVEVTFTRLKELKVKNFIRFNVDFNGQPFGAIWTLKARGDIPHPWYAILKDDTNYKAFWKKDGGLKAAKEYMIELARASI